MTRLDVKQVIIGSICIAISQILFGFNEVVIKLCGLKITQLVFGRYLVQLTLAVIWWNVSKPQNKFVKNWYGNKPYIANIWIRGALNLFVFTFWYSVNRLPLGDLQCIIYQAPLYIVLFGCIVLKEKLPPLFILIPSILLTIIGVILVSQPTFLIGIMNGDDMNQLNVDGIFCAFIEVFKWTFSCLLVRNAMNCHFLQLEIVCSGFTFFVALPIVMILNQMFFQIEMIGSMDIFDRDEWVFDIKSIVIMIYIGSAAFVGLSLSVIGYQKGNATIVSWLEYINIPIGFLYGKYIFNDSPNQYEIIGGLLVTIGCLLPVSQQIYHYFYGCDEVQFTQITTNSDCETDTVDSQCYDA